MLDLVLIDYIDVDIAHERSDKLPDVICEDRNLQMIMRMKFLLFM